MTARRRALVVNAESYCTKMKEAREISSQGCLGPQGLHGRLETAVP